MDNYDGLVDVSRLWSKGWSGMNADESYTKNVTEEWPRYTLKYTFGCEVPGIDATFEEDEVVLFDPTRKGGRNWISAKEGSYVPLEETR